MVKHLKQGLVASFTPDLLLNRKKKQQNYRREVVVWFGVENNLDDGDECVKERHSRVIYSCRQEGEWRTVSKAPIRSRDFGLAITRTRPSLLPRLQSSASRELDALQHTDILEARGPSSGKQTCTLQDISPELLNLQI